MEMDKREFAKQFAQKYGWNEGECQSCNRYFFYSVDLSFSTRKGK